MIFIVLSAPPTMSMLVLFRTSLAALAAGDIRLEAINFYPDLPDCVDCVTYKVYLWQVYLAILYIDLHYS